MQGPRIDPHLAKVPRFRALHREHLRLVSALATHLELPAGAVLNSQRGGLEFILVERGQVEVRRAGRIETRGPGEHVGDDMLADDGRAPAIVVASTPVVVEVIRREELLGLLDDFPDLADEIRAAAAAVSTGRERAD